MCLKSHALQSLGSNWSMSKKLHQEDHGNGKNRFWSSEWRNSSNTIEWFTLMQMHSPCPIWTICFTSRSSLWRLLHPGHIGLTNRSCKVEAPWSLIREKSSTIGISPSPWIPRLDRSVVKWIGSTATFVTELMFWTDSMLYWLENGVQTMASTDTGKSSLGRALIGSWTMLLWYISSRIGSRGA